MNLNEGYCSVKHESTMREYKTCTCTLISTSDVRWLNQVHVIPYSNDFTTEICGTYNQLEYTFSVYKVKVDSVMFFQAVK